VSASLADLRIRLLGSLEVQVNGAPISIGSPLQRAIVGILALDVGRSVSVHRLLEGAWPGSEGKKASLHVHISALRRILEPGHQPGREYQVLESTKTGYRLNIEPNQVDYHEFHHLIKSADNIRSRDQAQAVELYRQAEELIRGEILDEFEHDFALAIAPRFQETRLRVLEARIELELLLGRVDHLPAELSDLATEYPTREHFVMQLMTALVAMNRRADAVNAYHQHRRNLAERTGLEPSAELRLLEQMILLDYTTETTAGSEQPGRAAMYVVAETHRSLWVEHGGRMTLTASYLVELANGLFARSATSTAVVEPLPNGVLVVWFPSMLEAAAAAVAFQLRIREPDVLIHALETRIVLCPTDEAQGVPAEEFGALLAPYAPIGGVLLPESALGPDGHVGYPTVMIGELRSHIRLGTVALHVVDYEGLNLLPGRVVRSTLPKRVAPLIGRDDDVAAVIDHRQEGVLSIVGPPGVGKSALLVEVVHRLASEYDDGIWFVDLTEVAPGDTFRALAAALGAPNADAPPLERVLGALADRTALLAIDGVDQHVEELTQLIDGRNRLGVPATLIIASHRNVGLGVDHVHMLAPLSCQPEEVDGLVLPAPAERLLADRLARVGVTLVDDSTTNALRAQLCQHVDCLPVGLELLASRLRTTPLAELLAEFDRTGSLVAMSANHRKGYAERLTVTYDDLNHEAQRVFESLGAFAYPHYTPEGIAAVAGLSRAEAAAAIASLVGRSLVSVVYGHRESRYTSLDMVRQFARIKLQEAGEFPSAVDRSAAYFETMVTSAPADLSGPGEAGWVDHVAFGIGNILASVEHCVQNHAFDRAGEMLVPLVEVGVYRSFGPEVLGAIERAQTTVDQGQSPPSATFQFLSAALAWARGEPRKAWNIARVLLPETDRFDHALGLSLAIESVVGVASGVGCSAEHELQAVWQPFLTRLAHSDDPALAVISAVVRGCHLQQAEQPIGALGVFLSAIEAAEAMAWSTGAAIAHLAHSHALIDSGDSTMALAAVNRARQHADRVDNRLLVLASDLQKARMLREGRQFLSSVLVLLEVVRGAPSGASVLTDQWQRQEITVLASALDRETDLANLPAANLDGAVTARTLQRWARSLGWEAELDGSPHPVESDRSVGPLL